MENEGGASNGLDTAQSSAQTTTDGVAASDASTGGGSTATTSETKPAWASIDWNGVDLDEVIRSVPALQGKIGNLSQRQAQQLTRRALDEDRARREATEAAEAVKRSREEKRRLATEDPDALARKVTEEVALEEYQETQANLRTSVESELTGYIQQQVQQVYSNQEVQEVINRGNPETLAKLDWRRYDGLAQFIEAVTDVVGDHRADKKAQKITKARSAASDKEAAVNAAKDEAGNGVDLGLGGSVPGGRIFTRDELKSMPLEEYRKYKAIIAVQEREGRIR